MKRMTDSEFKMIFGTEREKSSKPSKIMEWARDGLHEFLMLTSEAWWLWFFLSMVCFALAGR